MKRVKKKKRKEKHLFSGEKNYFPYHCSKFKQSFQFSDNTNLHSLYWRHKYCFPSASFPNSIKNSYKKKKRSSQFQNGNEISKRIKREMLSTIFGRRTMLKFLHNRDIFIFICRRKECSKKDKK